MILNANLKSFGLNKRIFRFESDAAREHILHSHLMTLNQYFKLNKHNDKKMFYLNISLPDTKL